MPGKKSSEAHRVVKNGSGQIATRMRETGEEREREGATGNESTCTRKGRRLRVGLTTRPLLRARFLIPCGAICVPFPFNEFLVASSYDGEVGSLVVVVPVHVKAAARGSSAFSCTSKHVIVWIILQ